MRLNELRDLLEREVRYPVDRADLVRLVGDERLDSPNDDSDTIARIVDRAGATAFDSPGEVFDVVIGNVDEEFVGRKHYDDRGNNLQDHDPLSL